MLKVEDINKAISEGMSFLTKKQEKDGSFPSIASPDPKDFQKGKKCHTTFSTTFILQSLNTLEEGPEIQAIKKRVADFLLAQKSKHWTFNYWARQAEESKTMPFPDDLDDTSCALTALFKYNPKIIGGSVLGKFVMVLTALEEKEGGPYFTWLVKPDVDKVWKDVDLAVNSNIAYFLSLEDIELPNLKALIEKAIENKKFFSPYYPSFYPIIFFISRFYKGNKTKEIVDFLLSCQEKDGQWENPLNTALATLSLLNLCVRPEKLNNAINYLLENQQNNSWQWSPFYSGIKQYYAGSAELTTAFCLQALKKYQELSSTPTNEPVKMVIPEKSEEIKKQEEISNSIIKLAKERCLSLDPDLKKQVLAQISKIAKDKRIVLLPYFFKTALAENGKNISDKKIKQLGLANLYGWTAYTIYDDFFDLEGSPKLLSVANLMLRELTIIFNNLLPAESGFQNLFHKIMDNLDGANSWEVNNCRLNIQNNQFKIPDTLPDYGDYTKLAEKSLGHSLGPLAILFLLGYKEKSAEIQNLLSFFKHYIIARQLNDDAHDWEEDLKRGQINPIGALVLERWKQSTSPDKQKNNVLEIIPDLQKIFWYEILPRFCQNVLKQIESAEKSLGEISLISNASILTNLLVPIRDSAQKALTEREEAMKFLKAYNKPA